MIGGEKNAMKRKQHCRNRKKGNCQSDKENTWWDRTGIGTIRGQREDRKKLQR
jgi:hypothetical protein